MEFAAQLYKSHIKRELIAGLIMAKTVQVQECRTVIPLKANYAQPQMFHSVSQKITKLAIRIWDIIAIIHMTTQVVISIKIYQISVRLKILIIA